jgi:hypothetical protein
LGNITKLDSIKVIWPDGKQQLIKSVNADQRLVLSYADAGSSKDKPIEYLLKKSPGLFKDVSDSLGIDYVHKEADFIDFNVQKITSP